MSASITVGLWHRYVIAVDGKPVLFECSAEWLISQDPRAAALAAMEQARIASKGNPGAHVMAFWRDPDDPATRKVLWDSTGGKR